MMTHTNGMKQTDKKLFGPLPVQPALILSCLGTKRAERDEAPLDKFQLIEDNPIVQ